MAASKGTVLAFDLYGTLLSTESIAEKLAEYFAPEQGSSIAALWRRYQLEYTWRLNSMRQYQPFSDVTRNSLRHALAEHQVELDQESTQKLMEGYDSLSVFPETQLGLERLVDNPKLTPVVFSNGTTSMVSNSVLRSKGLSPYAGIFHDIVSVDPIRKFKPAPEAYWHLADTVGKERSHMNEMWLISGNPFDVMGAMNVGMKAAWVDRAGLGWIDSMNGATQPSVTERNLIDAVRAIEVLECY
ncbi:haloacid dehalogenase, type II [Emergomyces pasteurianus Ep9510]|uniref:Haloacid dehalogenase, type II n=1 Tax=Emergomyces pasteurianus Ep9510 TaxID=1447872 RepID=A0A1J9Q472_9EURO|nr:haloacid dehalogenase, type II [Emergomyces pasteurianus Ep9510]